MDIPEIDWSGQLRGVSLEGPVLVEDDPRWGMHWQMNLLLMAKAENSQDISTELRPMAFLYRVDGSTKTPIFQAPVQAAVGDIYDPNGGLAVTSAGPFDVPFIFNNLQFPGSGRYFYRVFFPPYGTQDSEEVDID
jgi:hypothetical protein